MNKYDVFQENLEPGDKWGELRLRINKQAVYRGDLKNILEPSLGIKDELKEGTPLAAAVIGVNNTEAPLPDKTQFFTAWTDIDAQAVYVESKPTCYLILSKPGAGAYSIGESLAKKMNCIHLCPRTLLSDEIDQESPTGKCLRTNIRMNKVITFNILLKLLKIKIESPVIKHRGYVISGFPLINTNREEIYFVQSLYGEESVGVVEPLLFDIICNLKRKPKKKRGEAVSSTKSSIDDEALVEEEQEEVVEEQQREDLIEEEEEEIKAELPKFILNTCSDLIFPEKPYLVAHRKALLEQLEVIFSFEMKPDIIIYLSSSDVTLVSKKHCKLFNNKTATYITDPFPTKIINELRWPPQFIDTDYVGPVDHTTHNECKYCCRHPMNFKINSTQQMCNYKNYVYPFVTSKLNDYDPKYIIKVDARQTLHEMMHNILETLVLLDLKPIIIPKPLNKEEPSEDLDEFWKSLEEMNAVKDGTLTFKRYPSSWFNRCPVELKNGRSVIGKPKFAVSFFKHVYLLSSLDAFIKFCWNPRPYLKLKYLEPSCRIIVIGTKSSGKTMISECLSWLFDIKPLKYESFLKEEREKKLESFAKIVLPDIVPLVEDSRLVQWQKDEMERISKLEQWVSTIMTLLEQFIPLLVQYIKYLSSKVSAEEQSEEAKEEVKEEEVKEEEFDEDALNKIAQYKKDLAFLPYLDDPINYVKALDRKLIARFAPAEYRTPIPRPPIPELRDKDVMEAVTVHVNTNNLQNEIEPTTEELMNELVRVINQLDNQQRIESNNERLYCKYVIDGFPSDPDYWGILADSKALPDYVIALIENREINQELYDFYKLIDNIPKRYQERFILAEDPLVQIKLLAHKPSVNKAKDMQIIINNLVNDTLLDVDNNDPELLASFSEKIAKFKEDIENIKVKLEENNKCFIEVELENKTDVQITEEVLMKLRQGYFITAEVNEDEEPAQDEEDENIVIDLLKFNPAKYCETNIYCPIAYYNYGVLWEGKTEFSLKHNDYLHLFSSEESLQLFQQDVTKYQSYNKPFKYIPPLRICVIGPVGSGKSNVAKLLAKELGLMHIDLTEVINSFVLPKHFKKVGRQFENAFTDVPFDDETVVEFQMNEENENLISNIISNEIEMRRMIYNYFESGSPILPVLMQKLLKKLWFEDPFVKKGIVFDGYPRLPSDVEDMVSCFCIPDLVIELESTSEKTLKNLSDLMFKKWKLQFAEAKGKARQKLDKERQEWMKLITKNIVVKLIVDELIENLFFSHPQLIEGLKGSNENVIAADTPTSVTSNVDTNLINTYNGVITEIPEPVDQTEWPRADDVRESIDTRLESIFDTDYENIQSLKDILSEQNIKYITIDATKSLNKMFRLILFKISNYRKRNQSFFEQTFIVSPYISDTLISEGYYFLSKFYRMCPVYIFENPNVIQNNYKVSKHKGDIFTVIHRSYLYFISGEENVKKFRLDPLKYVVDTNICLFKEYPLKIAIIGPPKSGKTALAVKLAKRFGLFYISRGKALRHVLYNQHWSEDARKLEVILRAGEIVKPKDIVMAAQTMIFDHRTKTNGYVLDGFPQFAALAMLLARKGTYPSIFLETKCDLDHVIEYSQREISYDVLKYMPPYPESYIRNRYMKLSSNVNNVRSWVEYDYLNLYTIDCHDSKWHCFQNVLNIINNYIPQVHNYLNHVDTDAAVPAGVMCISNETFNENCSGYKKLCPICFHSNTIKHGDCPNDKKGIVQYKHKYYWVCPDHMDFVLRYPNKFLKEADITIPELPIIVKTIHVDLVHENGICIVTYAVNLPSQMIVQGSSDFSASYKGKIYMMCSARCLEKFLAKPHLYADITVFSELKLLPPISLQNLPDVGYLEQTVGNILVQACCAVNVLRPKYPGLSIEHSALIYIGVYLKAYNPNVEKSVQERFLEVKEIYEARSTLIKRVGLIMRSMDNPFANYPKCCKDVTVTVMKQPSQHSAKFSIELIRRVPVPDERFDYLCEFHKPLSKVPAFLNVVDIAGLVRGAAEGQGLGNAFLSHIKACDAIFNLCRAFDDEDVIHVDGDVNPVRDLETIGEELRLKDEEQLLTTIEKLDRVVNRGGEKKLKPEYDSLMKIKAVLVDEKKHIRFGDWSAADIEVLNKYLFLTSKPALYLVNLSEKDYIRKKNKWLPKLKEWIDKNDPGAPLIPFSGVLETKLLDMDPQEREAFLKEHKITSALDKIIVQGYKALHLEYFFTAGPDEVKAWTIQKGTKAPQAAGRIHTDFEKGFIMAEVMHYKDFKEEGTEAACKAAGKYRQQGRNYVVEDGDIIFFKFNAGAGLKDAKKK